MITDVSEQYTDKEKLAPTNLVATIKVYALTTSGGIVWYREECVPSADVVNIFHSPTASGRSL